MLFTPFVLFLRVQAATAFSAS